MTQTPRWKQPVQRRAVPAPRAVASGRPPTITEAVEAMLRVSGWTERTRHTARVNLTGERFRSFLDHHGVKDVSGLTAELCAEYLAGLVEANLAPATVQKVRQQLITLERFCERTPGYESALVGVRDAYPSPRVPIKESPVLKPEDEAVLLRACHTERDRLVLSVLLATGVRVSELCALTLADLHLDERLPYVSVSKSTHSAIRTKNAEDRWAPLPAKLAKRLRTFVQARPDTHRLEVFLGSGAGVGRARPMTVAGVEAVFHRLEAETGIHCRPHMCRHTWATRAVNAGVPIFQLMQAGGWKDVKIVKRYYTGDRNAMLEAFARHS